MDCSEGATASLFWAGLGKQMVNNWEIATSLCLIYAILSIPQILLSVFTRAGVQLLLGGYVCQKGQMSYFNIS